MSTTTPPTADDSRIGACAYILHMLLQRADQQQPGLLDELIRGAVADRDSVLAQGVTNPQSAVVFDEALRMLQLANDQLQSHARP